MIDNAITSTISRTIITHGMYADDGAVDPASSAARRCTISRWRSTIGICFGIYSSVLVMAPLVMWLGVSREDLVKPDKKRGAAGAEKILP